MSVEELMEIKWRYLNILERRYKPVIRKLTWTRPGTVWAMDFTEPPNPVDEIFEQILVVDDQKLIHEKYKDVVESLS